MCSDGSVKPYLRYVTVMRRDVFIASMNSWMLSPLDGTKPFKRSVSAVKMA